ncbi:hypothetical protein MKSMC1_29320 [Mycobacterium kansasii]|nr:hypothetical protein MKSMC1_29320 [Mycobacterium kansasii]
MGALDETDLEATCPSITAVALYVVGSVPVLHPEAQTVDDQNRDVWHK